MYPTNSVSTSLRGYRLVSARAAWILLSTLAVSIFIAGLSFFIEQLHYPSPETADLLRQVGLSTQFYRYFVIGHEVLFASIFAGAAGVIFWRKSDDWLAILVSLMLITYGISETEVGGILVKQAPHWRWPVESMQAFGVAAMLVIFYLFPDGRFAPGWTRPLTAAWLGLVLVWLLFPQVPFNYIYGETAEKTPLPSFLFFLCWMGTGVAAQVYRYRRLSTAIQRQQTKWVVYGVVIAFAGGVIRFLPPALSPTLYSPEFRTLYDFLFGFPVGALFIVVWPVTLAAATLRYRLWDIDPLINRTLVYSTFVVLLGGMYVASIVLLQWLTLNFFVNQMRLTGQQIGLILLASTLILAALFLPGYRWIKAAIDRRFYRDQVDFRQAVTSFSNEVRLIINLPELLQLLVRRVTDLLHITHGAVFLRHRDDSPFQLVEARNLPPAQTAQLTLNGYSLELLRQGEAVSHPNGTRHYPLLLPLIAPQKTGNMLMGVLALGPRLSEQPYSREDRALLLSLANRAGNAIAVARAIEYERQIEAYRQSPMGRAETFAQELQLRPDRAVTELYRLAQWADRDAEVAGLLKNLPQVLANNRYQTMAGIAEGYHYIVSSRFAPEMLLIGLRQLIHSLSEEVVRGWLAAVKALAIYQYCYDALQVDSTTQAARLLTGLSQAVPPPLADNESPADDDQAVFLADLAHALTGLQPSLHLISSYDRTGPIQDRISKLTQVLEELATSDDELLAALSGSDRLIMAGILSQWRHLTARMIRIERDQAWLEIKPVTRHVLHTERVALVLEVTNTGFTPAYNTTVEMIPGNGYHLIDRLQSIEALESGQSQRIQFLVQPTVTRSFSPKFRISYDDATMSDKIWEFHTTILMLDIPTGFKAIDNPYIPGAVLGQGSPLFFGRTELLDFIQDKICRQGAVRALVLTGQRRIGKSSLAQQIPSRLGAAYLPVYLDCQRFGIDPGMNSFFYQLAHKLAAGLGCDPPGSDLFREQPAQAFEYQFLPGILRQVGERRLLLMFDEFELLEERVERGRLAPELFSYLRYLMLHLDQFVFVFVGSRRLAQLNPAYWSAVFNVALHKRVTFLTGDEAHALITRPVGSQLMYEDLAIDKMLRVTGGHPYFLQLLCHALVEQANDEQSNVVGLFQVNQALEQILELGEYQLLYLWQQTGDAEQNLLRAAAALATRGEAMTAAALKKQLQAAGQPASAAGVPETLVRLVEQELLQPSRRRPDNFVFGLDLLRLWVNRRYGD